MKPNSHQLLRPGDLGNNIYDFCLTGEYILQRPNGYLSHWLVVEILYLSQVPNFDLDDGKLSIIYVTGKARRNILIGSNTFSLDGILKL